MLSNKVIVVTGGAGLLGRDFCVAIAEKGARVIVTDMNIEAARKVSDEINKDGGKAEAYILNITDTESIDNLINLLHSKYGRIDAVINNAYPRNKNYGKKLEDVTYEDFSENLSIHAGGYFLVAKKFAIYFRNYDRGNIINIASIYGSIAPRFDIYAETAMTMPVEYAAIKSSIIHLTRYFAQYFKSEGIRCNALSPGGVLDEQPKAFLENYKSYCGKKGMLTAQDLIGALIFLLSDNSLYITGQNLIVDDGFSL